ncbi:MAG: hypothetical protein O3B24_04270 [Verrucomicrobia bacterium]|nr:hypothetical protein [Verrucomicrobiota bacterium]
MVGDWRKEKTFLFKDDADHERFFDRLSERDEQAEADLSADRRARAKARASE